MTDSGYTRGELDRLLDQILAVATIEERERPDAGFVIRLELGLLDGDVVAVSEVGTVMLNTPREVIGARVAEMKAALVRGYSLDEALAGAIAAHPD